MEETGQSLYERWTTFIATKPKIADVVSLLDVPKLYGTVTEYLRIALREDSWWQWKVSTILFLLGRVQDPEILNLVIRDGQLDNAEFDELADVICRTESGDVARHLGNSLESHPTVSVSDLQSFTIRVGYLAGICEMAKTAEAREVAGRCLIALHKRVASEGDLNRRLVVEIGLVAAADKEPEIVKRYLRMDPESMVAFSKPFLNEDPLRGSVGSDDYEPKDDTGCLDAPEFLPIPEFMLSLVLKEDEWAVGSFRSALCRGQLKPPIPECIRAATTARSSALAKLALEYVFEHGELQDLVAILRGATSSSIREEVLAILESQEQTDWGDLVELIEEMSDADLHLTLGYVPDGHALGESIRAELASRPSWHVSEIRKAAGIKPLSDKSAAAVEANGPMCRVSISPNDFEEYIRLLSMLG